MLQGLDLVWSLLTLLRQARQRETPHLANKGSEVWWENWLVPRGQRRWSQVFSFLVLCSFPCKTATVCKGYKINKLVHGGNQLHYFSHKQKSMQPTVGTHYSFILNSAWSSWCLCLSEEWNHYPGNAKGKKNVIQKEYLLLVTKCLEHTAILQSLPIWIFCFFSNKIVFWQFSQNDGISCDLSFVWFVDVNRISKMSSFRKRIPKC